MDEIPEQETPPPARAGTLTVAGVLLAAAMMISWLAAYAMPNALVAADLIAPWADGQDRRPMWLLSSFILITSVFFGVGLLLKWKSRRDVGLIEELVEAEETA